MSQSTTAGATRLRRRLSKIFQREMSGSSLRSLCPCASGAVGKSPRAICQSPRGPRGVVVQKFYIRHERGTRLDTFKQVMTEQRVFGHAFGERAREGVHVVQAFACESAFAEKVLINVRGSGRVRVTPRVTREGSRETRERGTLQRDADAWLQDAIAARDALHTRVELRTVQRVFGDADETAGRVARQLRVGVERDDVTNLREQFGAGRRDDVARVARSAQKAVELLQLTAFTLPAHPLPFARVPLSLALKEVEALEAGRVHAVARVQLVDGSRRLVEERRVPRSLGCVRVREVAEQCVIQVLVLIS